MTFQIDTGAKERSTDWHAEIKQDGGFAIDLSNWTRADRFKRQTIEAIWGVGDAADLDALTSDKDMELEALFLSHPDLWDEIDEALDECRAGFSAAQPSAQADTVLAEPANSLGIEF